MENPKPLYIPRGSNKKSSAFFFFTPPPGSYASKAYEGAPKYSNMTVATLNNIINSRLEVTALINNL
jgi:hypothetical protein